MEGNFGACPGSLPPGRGSPVCEMSVPCSARAERRRRCLTHRPMFTLSASSPPSVRALTPVSQLDGGALDYKSPVLRLVYSWSLISDCSMSCTVASMHFPHGRLKGAELVKEEG